jgi:hypothetical protein
MGNFMSVPLLFHSVVKHDGQRNGREKSKRPPLSKSRQEPAIQNLGHGSEAVKEAMPDSKLPVGSFGSFSW